MPEVNPHQLVKATEGPKNHQKTNKDLTQTGAVQPHSNSEAAPTHSDLVGKLTHVLNSLDPVSCSVSDGNRMGQQHLEGGSRMQAAI